ncbi:MAG: DUF3047 domain-containing protein [bacterium]
MKPLKYSLSKVLPATLLFTLFSFALHAGWQTPSPQEVVEDDFSKNDKGGDFPKGWKTYPFQMGKAKAVYKIGEENGKKFVRANDSQDISMPIFKDFPWPLEDYPILKWRWRAQQLPVGAKENSRDTNDSACGVYVTFGKTSGIAIKYVWSSSLPPGHVWAKEPGEFYVVVMDSGSGKLGQWQEQKANVLADFKKLFGKDPSRDPTAIGIMTDGNATHTASACDYGDFVISKP